MEAVGAASEEARLVVEPLDEPVRDLPADVGDDLVEILADRLRRAHEGREPRPERPRDPAEQEGADHVRLPSVEDVAEQLLEEVSTVEAKVGALELGELCLLGVGQVHEVLEQRPARVLERLGGLGIVPSQLLPQLAARLVDGLAREPLDVEAVENDLRVRHGVADGVDERAAHVHAHDLDLLPSLLAKLVEERLERRRVLALLAPDDPALDVIGDERQVVVVLPVADLIDADGREAIELVRSPSPLHDALVAAPDRAPGDPEHVLDRGLVATLREVSHLLVEVVREPRARLRAPRHALDDDAALRALNAANVVAQEQRDPREVEVSPPTLLGRDPVPGPTLAAPRAPGPTPRRTHANHERLVLDLAGNDASPDDANEHPE